jgi:hypothetical protein
MSEVVKTGSRGLAGGMSASPLESGQGRTFAEVRFVPILLQKSVEGFREQ